MTAAAEPAERTFSICEGGAFYRLTQRLHLLRPAGMTHGLRLVAIAWLPLIIGAGLRMLAGIRPDPIVFDISVHARILLGIPLLVSSERRMEPMSRGAMHQLYIGSYAKPDVLERIVRGGERMRDAVWVEVVLACVAVLLGQLALWRVLAPTGVVAGITETPWSISRVWYTAVSLPLVQFLIMRWMWRWVIWTVMLVRLSRAPLKAIANHPDRAAGLECLGWPLIAFGGYVLAVSCILSGAWATQLIDHRVTVPGLLPTLAIFVIAAVIIGCAPLLLFSRHLFGARRVALAQYTPFALAYVRSFDNKWIQGKPDEPLLGTPDIQSWNDLGGAFSVIQSTRLFVFSMSRLRDLFVAAMLPMLPLVATVVPVEKLLARIGGAAFGISL
jgi:hypothetical protein